MKIIADDTTATTTEEQYVILTQVQGTSKVYKVNIHKQIPVLID